MAVPRALQMVFAFVGGNTAEPLPFISGGTALPMEPGGEKRLLCEILRRCLAADKSQANGVNQMLVLLHKMREFLFFQRTPPPCCGLTLILRDTQEIFFIKMKIFRSVIFPHTLVRCELVMVR